MKKLSYLMIVLIALVATMIVGCSPALTMTTLNNPGGTELHMNRAPHPAEASYVPRSFTAALEAGPDGVSETWVGNPDSAALANLANAKAKYDSILHQQIEAMQIDNAMRAQETIPGFAGAHAIAVIANNSGHWAWVQTGPNSGLKICPTQTSQTLFLRPGSRLHLDVTILSGRPPQGSTPPRSLIIGNYSENWLVPGVDDRLYLPNGDWVNGIYTITWPHAGGYSSDQSSQEGGNGRAWSWWNTPGVRAHW